MKKPPHPRRVRRAPYLALSAALLLVGCGDAGRDAPRTDATSRALLSAAPTVPTAVERTAQPARAAQEAPQEAIDVANLGYDLGEPDAPVRVLEISDFGCAFCRKFHEETWPTLRKEFVETGKVQWKYVPFILGIFPNAVEAAHAGECAGEQGKFVAMQTRLFDEQPQWKKSAEPYALFRGYAREEGLDMKRYNQCVKEQWRAKRIQSGTALGRQLGVRGTPTFFIVGYAPLQGALPLATFRQVLDMVYADQKGRAQADTGAGAQTR